MTLLRTALVTGASSGFGQATAALLAAQGFRVFGTSRAPAPNAPGSYELLPLGVRSEASIQLCVHKVLERTGRIDLLVNNAGFAQGGAVEENSLEDARGQFETNVFGVFRMLKAVLPVMRSAPETTTASGAPRPSTKMWRVRRRAGPTCLGYAVFRFSRTRRIRIA